ncbi:hypothetical protein EASAB2608_02409 [Streptomyces sp. EAS-AB2608]|nr:hypothetical protein EASAB2608_02409 [Streptomyces sp. EAS-AB2608]
MPTGAAAPTRREGADDGESAALLVVGLRLSRQRPGAIGVGYLHAQSAVVLGETHADLPAGRRAGVRDGVAHQFREQQLSCIGDFSVDLPFGELRPEERAGASGAARTGG